MDKETAKELIDALKEMNNNILLCTNEVCENAKKIERLKTNLDDLNHKLDLIMQLMSLCGDIIYNSYIRTHGPIEESVCTKSVDFSS